MGLNIFKMLLASPGFMQFGEHPLISFMKIVCFSRCDRFRVMLNEVGLRSCASYSVHYLSPHFLSWVVSGGYGSPFSRRARGANQ